MLAIININVLGERVNKEFTLLNSKQFYRVKVGNLVVIYRVSGRRVVGTVTSMSDIGFDIEQSNGDGLAYIVFSDIFSLWFQSINTV